MTDNNELENTPDIEISEPEIIPNPWDDAPTGVYFYEKIYPDGHLGSFTKSPELAYKFGWFDNSIPEEDLEVSDVNGWTYLKDKCPHKTQEMIDRENAIQEISQLKKQLSDTDYKAIKFAEGILTEEEYAPDKLQRAYWRQRINLIQQEFNL